MKSQLTFVLLLAILILSGCAKQERDAEGSTPDGDHAHDHDHTPHLGVMAVIRSDQGQSCVAELKLHDDKGDLELWLSTDDAGTEPFDLTLDAVITVTFPNLDGRAVELRVRNSDRNEDEDGRPNIRDGKTNYFTFPGDTGADASFLVGKTFSSEAVISFELDAAAHASAPVVLTPHVH